MPTIYHLLKDDPYNTEKRSQTYIDPNVFYSEENSVYLHPEKNIKEVSVFLEHQCDSSASILRINGYAGCGKTLFAHYITRNFGKKEFFWYEFDRGEEKEYSLDYVIKRILLKLSREIAYSVKQRPSSIAKFKEYGRQFIGEEILFDCVNTFFLDHNHYFRSAVGSAENKTIVEMSAEIKKGIQSAYDGKDITESSVLIFLLILDYLLRCAILENETQAGESKVAFCLLDNIDNLRRDVVAELFCAIVSATEMIRRNYLEAQRLDEGTDFPKFVYLFPTRAVTERKLKDELRRTGRYELIDRPGIMDCCNLSLDSKAQGGVISNRIQYWKKQSRLSTNQEDELYQVKALIETQFAQGSFSSLFNNNYSRCVDRLLEFWKDYRQLIEECVAPLIRFESAGLSQIRSASLVAPRGIFLRILLEILKAGDAYASPTDFRCPSNFQINSKLGLADLNPHDSNQGYCVSLSRLLLTYLKSKKTKTAYLSELFDCFSDYDPKEICRCVYALSENIRDKWRRLVMFNRKIPVTIDDLYAQATAFQNQKETEYSEIELCVAGEEYINVVVPSFEFFLSRLDNERNNLGEYPPLFSSLSMESGKWKNSLRTVLESVERCAEQLYIFDTTMIENLLSREKGNEIQTLFVASRSDQTVKQSHLSRLVFSHISYIEAFRRYYLWYWSKTVSEEKRKPMRELVRDNELIISYIIRYLTLFNKNWVHAKSMYVSLLENQYLRDDYKLCVYYLCDCYSVYTFLQEKGNPYLFSGSLEGFRRQSSAQRGLLDKILEIHEKGYSAETFIIPIEIENETKGGHK